MESGLGLEEEPELADDDEIENEVPVERGNTLKRVRDDYDTPWVGVLRESIQNGTDAWGRHRSDGILPEDANLEISIDIDTDEGTFTYRDNAGGMTEQTLEKNLVGIDTPDEEKQRGMSAGAYGRGFYVIAMCGTSKTYVETRQGSEHSSVTISTSGHYSEPSPPDNSQLGDGIQGTFIHVRDVREQDLEKLSTWNEVEDALLKNFTFLLLQDDVTVKYRIDGEVYQPSPPNLEGYREEGEILHKERLPEFSAEGGTYQVEDLVVIRTDVMEEDPPWEGVAMLKGNEQTEPFMTVKAYKPHRIPSLRSPPDMVGWCNANDLCPDLENNAHTSFKNNSSETGIKEELVELHNEYFKQGRTTEERDQLAGDITDSLNELLNDYEDFSDYYTTAEEEEGVENEEASGDEGEAQDGSDQPDWRLRLQAGQRSFDVGERVPLEAIVRNPDDADQEKYEICNIEIQHTDSKVEQSLTDRSIGIETNETRTIPLEDIKIGEKGRCRVKAEIRPKQEVMTLGSLPESIDSSVIYLTIGDVKEEQPSPSEPDGDEGSGEKDGKGRQQIVQDTSFASGQDSSWKTVVTETEDGGFEVIINTGRPEWVAATRINDDEEKRNRIQKRLGVEWGVQEIVLERNIDDIRSLLQKVTVEEENAAETLVDRFREREELLAELDAEVTNRFGVEYGN